MVELLAPVGNKEAFYSAIENHADAIYLGGKMFGARAYSNNFTNEEIRAIIDYAHLYGVKVYITVNTIVFDEEFSELIKFLDFLYSSNVDAIIVQDLGVISLARKRYPHLEIHASTQMNIHGINDAKLLKELGVSRIVLARETTIDEIRLIKKTVDIEIEVFVHGALCVSYSGNCYYSSFVGKRSGNRGRCAQPCRLEYNIEKKSGYLISPKDLSTLEYLDELIEAGVDSLKIEGRMKRPEYVSLVVKTYKERMNAYYNKLTSSFDYKRHYDELKKVFNRGFTKGFGFNESNDNFINEVHSNHIGIEIGKVISSKNGFMTIKLTNELSFGDSIRIVGKTEDAVTINQIYRNNENIKQASSGNIIRIKSHISDKNLDADFENAKVYLTSDFKQLNELKLSYTKPSRKILITGKVYLENEYLILEVMKDDKTVKTKSSTKVEAALKQAVNDRIIAQLEKTADTKFEFSRIELNIDKPIFINIKEINELRRKSLNELETRLICMEEKMIVDHRLQFETNNIVREEKAKEYKFKVKVRNIDQLKVALNYDVEEIYTTDLSLLNYHTHKNVKIKYFIPRVVSDELIQELKNRNLEDSIVSSNLAMIGETSSTYMNITNIYAVHLLETLGVKTIGLSIELSRKQITDLVNEYKNIFRKTVNLEIMVYGKYELMMMKYALTNSFEDKKLAIMDRKNTSYDIIHEDGTDKILSSKRVFLKSYLEELKDLGVNNFLIDFTTETKEEVKDIMDIFILNKNKNLNETFTGHYEEGII